MSNPTSSLTPIWIIPSPTLKDRKCGACIGLYRQVLKGKEVCSASGVTENSRACAQFKVDHHVLTTPSSPATNPESTPSQEPVMSMLEAIRNAPTSLLQYVPHLLHAEGRIRQHARRNLLAQVYFRWQGKGYYLSNYVRGMIIDADRTHITLIGENGKTIYVMLQSDFRRKAVDAGDWALIKEKMIEKGRLHDPSISIKVKKLYNTKIEIPTFDQVAEVDDKTMRNAVQRADLATLMTELSTTGTISRTYDGVKSKSPRLTFGYEQAEELPEAQDPADGEPKRRKRDEAEA